MNEGERAADFSLPGVHNGEQSRYCLSETTNKGNYVVLFFYPFDFSPVCTNELCAIRDAELFQFMPDVVPWGISGDSAYAHQAFSTQYQFDFPLLGDSSGAVSAGYGVQYDEWDGHEAVPKRAVFVVDPDRRIRYRWSTDNALEEPDLFPLKEAIETIVDEDDLEVEESHTELTVDYETPLHELNDD